MGQKDIAIPFDSIAFTAGRTICLKIDKAAAKALPAIKVKRN